MYKNDRQRIEDAIIPYMLEALMLTHIKDTPEHADSYKKALDLVRIDIKKELNNPSLIRRATRIEKEVLKMWQKNKYNTRKAYMVLSYLAASLHEQEAVILGDSTRTVLDDMNKIIVDAYDDENIKKQDISAAKQVKHVTKILNDNGLF